MSNYSSNQSTILYNYLCDNLSIFFDSISVFLNQLFIFLNNILFMLIEIDFSISDHFMITGIYLTIASIILIASSLRNIKDGWFVDEKSKNIELKTFELKDMLNIKFKDKFNNKYSELISKLSNCMIVGFVSIFIGIIFSINSLNTLELIIFIIIYYIETKLILSCMGCIEKLYQYKDEIIEKKLEKELEKRDKKGDLTNSYAKKLFAKRNESAISIQKYNEAFAKTTNEIFLTFKNSIEHDKPKKTIMKIKPKIKTKVKSITPVSKKQRISHNMPKKRRNIK